MKLFSLITVLMASLGSASATIITYDTIGSEFTGTFNGSPVSGTSISATSGTSTATLTYNPITAGSNFDDATPGTNISYGTFALSYSGPDVSVTFPQFSFSLKVNETAPGSGSQTVAAISNAGTVSLNSSNVNVFYVPTAFTLPSAVPPNTAFTIVNPTQIVPSTTNSGVSSIQGFALGTSATSTPEPVSAFLMGAGLLGIGMISRKKFASRA